MDFDILDRHTRCTGLHFLEASAGTGKTFAIEHLVVRLVLEGIPLEQILVLTFTRKATRELKLRIKQALERTKEELKRRASSSDYLIALLEREEGVIKEKSALIDAALICFDSAAIFTLHGFCYLLLTEFSFEGKVAALPSPDEIHGVDYYRNVVRHFLLRKLSREQYAPIQLLHLLKRVKNDPQKLIDKIAVLLADGAAISRYPHLQEQYTSFCAHLAELPSIEKERFKRDVESLATCYKGIDKAALSKESELWSELLSRGCSKEQFELLLKEEESVFDAFDEGNRKVKSALPEKLYYPGLIARLKKGALVCLKQSACPERTLLCLARDCKMSEEANIHLTPDQMVERLKTALEEERFLKSAQQKYQAAIIDEFQDTDPTQWAIFKRLFFGSVKTLCLVGDPKQSIYAFRRADIYTYLQARDTLGSAAHRHLNTNYRSSPSLVHALNQLFAMPQEGKWFPLPKSQSAIAAQCVKAGLKEEVERERGRIHFFITSGKRGRSLQWPSFKMEEELFAFIAQETSQIKAKTEVPLEEIAVLVKDRFQAERLISYLKKKGIPASFRRGRCASAALFAFTRLVEALLYPSDVSRLKIALFGPLIGLNEKEMTADALEAAKMQMLTLNKLLHQEGISAFFHHMLTRVLPKYACRDPELYRELQILQEYLIEEQMSRGLQPSDLLNFLKSIDSQDLEMPPHEASGSLSILTVHLSKGLEFNTVFALSVASRHVLKEGQVIKNNQTLFVFDQTERATQEGLQEIDAEKMRLLYVALTRAKAQLYIPLAVEEGESVAQQASPIELFFIKIGPESPEIYLAQLATSSSLTYERIKVEKWDIFHEERLPFLVEPPSIDFLPEPSYLTSFTSLAVKTHLEHPVSDDKLPLGAKTGVVLHAIFEAIFAKRAFKCNEIAALIDAQLVKTVLKEYRETIFSLVTQQLNSELFPGFFLRDLAQGQYIQELEFLYPIKKGMMKGAADLWFIHENKYYLLDWKSNCLPSYTREEMEKAMRTYDYFLQASIYAEALKRYVKLFDNRPFAELFGGALYLFVRGKGVYHFIPEVYDTTS